MTIKFAGEWVNASLSAWLMFGAAVGKRKAPHDVAGGRALTPSVVDDLLCLKGAQ